MCSFLPLSLSFFMASLKAWLSNGCSKEQTTWCKHWQLLGNSEAACQSLLPLAGLNNAGTMCWSTFTDKKITYHSSHQDIHREKTVFKLKVGGEKINSNKSVKQDHRLLMGCSDVRLQVCVKYFLVAIMSFVSFLFFFFLNSICVPWSWGSDKLH